MLLAVHMKNVRTNEKRVYKTEGKDSSLYNWECPDFGFGSDWVWTGTEPFENIEDKYMPVKPRSKYYVHR